MQFAYANRALGYLAQIARIAGRPLLVPVRRSVIFCFSILAKNRDSDKNQ